MLVLFYDMRFSKMSFLRSAKLIIDECLFFWKKSRNPFKDKLNCIKKCKKIYETWCNFQKSKNQKVLFNKIMKNKIEEHLEDLFDIAQQNALNDMTTVWKRKFWFFKEIRDARLSQI